MIGRRRRLGITLFVVVGALVLAAAGSSWLLVRIWGPSLTASRIARAISEASGRPAHVDGVALEPLRGRLRILGLTVSGEPEPVLRVARVDVGIRIESLWRLELVVGIVAHGAIVRLRPEPGTPSPTTFEMPERFRFGPIAVRLAAMRAVESQLRFEDSSRDLALALDGLGVEGRPDHGGLALTVRADALHLRAARFSETLGRLSAAGRIDAARIAVREAELAGDGGQRITARGAVESPWGRAPALTGEVTARLALGSIAQKLGAPVPIDGTAAIDLTLGGTLAAPVIDGRLRVPRLGVAGAQARDLSAALRLDQQTLTVADVAGEVLGGRLRGSLVMPVARPKGTIARFRLEDVQAGALARLRSGRLDVGGRVTLDGEARGDLARPRSLSGQLGLDASELSLPGSLARLGAGRLRASARMAGGQIVSDARGHWPAASLAASARLEPDDRLRVEARFTADLSPLPGWGPGDAVDLAARGEGRWPQVTLTAGADLARTAAGPGGQIRRAAGRVDLRLDPLAGAAPRWSGVVRSPRLSLPWGEIAEAQGTLAVSTESLEISRLVGRAAGIPVEGSGRWAWRGEGDARLVAGPAALARLPGIPSALALDGVARGQVQVGVSGAGVHGTARVEAERVSVASVALGRGAGEATVQGRTLAAALRFPERQLEMSARGELAAGRALAAHLALRSFDLALLTARPRPGETPGRRGPAAPGGAVPPALRGTISASADLAIPVDTPRNVRGALTVQPVTLAIAGTPWSSAAAIVARIDGQRAILEPARLAGPAGTITAGGVAWDAAAPPLVAVKLEARLAALAPALGLDGRLRAEAELSGDAGAVAGTRAHARIDGDGMTLPGPLARLGAGTGHAELHAADGAVSLAKGDVAFPGLALEVGGRINLDGRLALDARATARAEPLGAALGWSNSSGTATATATLRGSLGQPDGHARLVSERLSLAGVAMERVDASARLQGETVSLRYLTARVLGAPLIARGEWAPSGAGRAELEAGPLALAQLAGAPERLALGGTLSVRAEATTEGGRLRAGGSLELRDTRAAGLVLGTGRLAARVDGSRLQADFDLAERRITGAASGRLEKGGAVDGELNVSTLDLAPLLRHLSGNSDVEGSVSGRFTARVPWDRPSALTARARLDPVALRSRGSNVDARGPVVARWENATLTLERAELAGSAGTARVSGSLAAGGRLDAELDARIPLAPLLAPVAEVSGAEGTVAVQAHVTGTLAEPSLRGEGSLTGGRVALRALPAPLRDITARVVATPGSLRLAEAAAALGSGSLRATGEVAVAGLAPGIYRVRLTGRDVPVRVLEGLDTLWNADLELGGAQGRALLSGEARLVRGTYSRDLVTLSALTAPERAATGGARGLPLSIRASLDDNLLIRTSMARMRVGGTINVRGTTAAPVLLGTLEARDGTLVLRGQRYQLERAVVRFTDPRRIEPLLDVTATTRIRDHDVTMRALGGIRNLDLRLSSSPSLPRDQLLSLVAYGTTGRETGKGAGGAVAGEAAALVVRELLDLSSGGEGPLPAPVRAIMESTRVSYTHSSEDVGRFGIRVEYEVAGPFLLAGERTSEGYYVVDGVVRLRFR